MSRKRIAFIGAGWIGRQRMETMLAGGRVEACAICEPDPAAAQAARALAPEAAMVATLDDALALAPDGVAIATPSALDAAQSLAALEAGAAVFCQKPLGRSAAEVCKILAAARGADLLLGVDMSYRFTEAMRAVRREVCAGAIGHVYAVELIFHNAYGPDKPWFYDPLLSGGGCLIDLGIHLVDLALWTLGWPRVTEVASRLFANGEPWRPGIVEDHALATLALEDGAAIRLACSWHLSAGQDAVIAADFHGTKGSARLRNLGGSFYDFVAERCEGTHCARLVSPPDPWSGRAGAVWADLLAEGAGFAQSPHGLVEASEALDRIYAAAAPIAHEAPAPRLMAGTL